MIRPFLSGSALVLFAHLATAQSINIDFEPAASPLGVPSPTYGGPAGSPGVWNSVSSASVTNLKTYDGTVTNVSLSTLDNSPGCTGQLFMFNDDSETSLEHERLLDDRWSPDSIFTKWTFQGLANGDYDVVTIVVNHQGCANGLTQVYVTGSPDPLQHMWGTWSGSYVQASPDFPGNGGNFALHRKTVTDGTLEIGIDVYHPANYVFVSGIQLSMHEQDYVGQYICPGDGDFGTCPCNNSGQNLIGCQNSQGTGGSWLFASGAINPDTIVLHAAGELPNALSIFWQGTAVILPVVYGDGLRCAGGNLRRLYTKNASGGVVFAPALGDPSITARSAAIGVPIVPGGRRYYQVSYRDGNASFCPSPTGSSYNISNGVKISW